jgi:hypothetical protein
MTNYKGDEYQVAEIENVTPPLSVGQDEILYHLLNRHGDIIQVMDWELDNDRKRTKKYGHKHDTLTEVHYDPLTPSKLVELISNNQDK